MRFLVDACVDIRVGEWLRTAGNDVVHLRDQGLQRLPDAEVFTKAAGDDRIVLTFDLDFGEIAALSKSRSARVILMRLKDTRVAHVCDRLRAVLPACAEALKLPAVVIVEESRYRIRRLPIGAGGDPA